MQFETILSPLLLPLYDLHGKTVVVIDILRATSTICTGLNTGVEHFLAVSQPTEAIEAQKKGYIAAAERNAVKPEGFLLGNSPFEYLNKDILGKKIAITTTNGTRCISLSNNAYEIIIGSFLNLNAVAKYCINSKRDVVAFCAGWKDKFNLEDTLFAGALANKLAGKIEINCDSTIAAIDLYKSAENNLFKYLKKASHAKRFEKLGIKNDMKFCLQMSIYDIVPKVENGVISLKNL
ncbi:MAG: 2-phosphosulfolactate phosphatase [Bacteroidia bacterium]|nr:2-phosphosulfolactate phosphatase [Bacteroidia bacterium]